MKQKIEMKSIYVAIFGHYDSRGGTTAIELPELSRAAVDAACRRYNVEVFGIEEAGEPIKTTAYGMAARKADQIVHDMMHGDRTPAQEDLMFIAQLHYRAGIDLERGELESVKFDGYATVLKEGGEEDQHLDLSASWDGWQSIKRVKKSEKFGDKTHEWEVAVNEDDVIKTSIEQPVQLEYVQLKTCPWPARLERIRMVEVKMKAIVERIQATLPPVYSNEYHEEIKRRRAEGQIGSEWQKLGQERDRLIEELYARLRSHCRGLTKVIKDPTTARWDDDAYSFVLLRHNG